MDWVNLRKKCVDIVKKYKYALLILLVGLVLMLFPGAGATGVSERETIPQPTENVPDMEDQLTAILSQIQGAGKVQVMLSVSQGERVVYQTDEDISGGDGGVRSDTVIVSDGNRVQSGLIQQVNPPSYLGAVIVCQGADKPAVRLAMVEAVSKATGLGADRISVLKMK